MSTTSTRSISLAAPLLALALLPPAPAPAAPAQQAASAPIGLVGTTCIAFETIEQGQYSGFGYYCGLAADGQGATAEPDGGAAIPSPPCYADLAAPAFEGIIRDACTWQDFWTQHTSNVFPPPPAPAIDFNKDVVVAVISGSRPSGCYGMEITSISRGACQGNVIRVRERVPCPGEICTLALTNNYHFVKVCKDLLPLERPVCFEHRNKQIECDLTVACLEPAAR